MSDLKLKLLVLKTQGVATLREFYTLLGFQFAEEKHGQGPKHFSANFGDSILEIYPLKSGEADSTTRLGFEVRQLATLIDSLRPAADVIVEPKQTEWGMRAVVRDPDGRSIELYQSLSATTDSDA